MNGMAFALDSERPGHKLWNWQKEEMICPDRENRYEYTEELHKKGPNDSDNHNGMTTHLDPDILGCEVKQALGSITMNKDSGADRIPADLT